MVQYAIWTKNRTMILKLKLMVNGEDHKSDFITFYMDATHITNFFIPDTEEYEGPCINILYQGSTITVKQTPNLLKYLKENFVDKVK